MHSKRRSMKNKKAISPVIATVILVAVSVAIAIAVAFWAAGLAGTFTRFEKLEIGSAYSTANDTAGWEWNVYVSVRNTGSSDATITDIFVNGKPLSAYGGNVTNVPSLPIPQPTGTNSSLVVSIKDNAGFINGQTIEVKLHTASGTDYPKSVVLP